jgi:hypothetical protein
MDRAGPTPMPVPIRQEEAGNGGLVHAKGNKLAQGGDKRKKFG